MPQVDRDGREHGSSSMKKTCERCRRETLSEVVVDDSTEVSGHTFTAQVPATRCSACNRVTVLAEHVKIFERRIAVELAKAGTRSASSFKFQRTVLEMTDTGIAGLLDVPVEYIGYWESDKWPMDPRAMAVLAAFVLARFDGQSAALDCLRVLRSPRK